MIEPAIPMSSVAAEIASSLSERKIGLEVERQRDRRELALVIGL
jgi:hypothetical protein